MYNSLFLLFKFCLISFGDKLYRADSYRHGKRKPYAGLIENEEKEEHNKDDEERIDHPLTPSTSNSKSIIDTSVFSMILMMLSS